MREVVTEQRASNGLRPEREHAAAPVLLEVVDLKKHFPITRGIVFQKTIGHVHAVASVVATEKAVPSVQPAVA